LEYIINNGDTIQLKKKFAFQGGSRKPLEAELSGEEIAELA